MAATRTEIENMLIDMRTAIDSGKYLLVPRKKNMETLARLGITSDDAIETIYSLSYIDYVTGPEVDRDFPQSDCLWVFRKYEFGSVLYIKFKVVYQSDGGVKVVSFHIANM